MQKTAISLLALLCMALARGAQAQIIPGTANLRFSEQVSNAPAGTCGCFGLEGFAGDAAWNLFSLGTGHSTGLGIAGDFGVVHTGQVNGGNYGLTLTTFTAGPRLRLPGKRLQTFGQALFGVAHGSDSQFPTGNTLVSSASSFAMDFGGAQTIRSTNAFPSALSSSIICAPIFPTSPRVGKTASGSEWGSPCDLVL